MKFKLSVVIATVLSAFSASAIQAQSSSGRPPVLRGSSSRPSDDPRPPVLRGSSARPTSNDAKSNTRDSQPQEVDENSVLRVSTSLITVPAVVMDRDGRYIGNLQKEDFQVFEDGVAQKVTYFAPVEKPFTVALMLDVSGSTQSQLAQIREAANAFVSRLRLNDRLMAITFDGQVHVLTEPETVRDVRRTKLHIPEVTDGTVLYDAVQLVLKRIEQIPGRKAIVLMTDGVDQNSRVAMKDTLEGIAEQDVSIYTVQYNTLPQLPERLSRIKDEKARRKVRERLLKGYAVSEPYLRTLAEKTGGRFYRADDLRDVAPAFTAITTELGVQYSLGYYSNSHASGGDRQIKVRVRYPNLVVRTRDSYSTSSIAQKE
jgi:Ca-activated chloride channel family protein